MKFILEEEIDNPDTLERSHYIYELEHFADKHYNWTDYRNDQIYNIWRRNANIITPAREKEIEEQEAREAEELRKANEPKQLSIFDIYSDEELNPNHN